MNSFDFRNIKKIVFFLGLFVACQPSISSDTSSNSSFFDTNDQSFIKRYLASSSYMPVSEIKPGMTGYGLSVFQGTTVEKFDVKVIGVVKKVLNGRDAILVKLSGPSMEKNNVIRGMSGSPVYINNKLVGAVSFGYDFSKEPIAGLTPIVDMLDSLADSSDKKLSLSKLNERSIKISASESGLKNTSSGELKMIPLVSPVALAGFSPRAEQFLSKYFSDLGMMVNSGASGAMNANLQAGKGAQIKPGSAISVLLTTGDFTSVATGTATARFGNKVLAFGHPFLSAGAIEFPMASAYIHKVLSSLSVSFKISSPLAELGSFTADRPWACGGQIGHQAKMIPVSYTVIDETRKIQRSFNCQIVDHPDLTPQMLAATAMSAIDSTHQYTGPYIAKVESQLEAEGIEPIIRHDRFASNIASHSILQALMSLVMGDSIAGSIYRNTSSIANNEFRKASIKSFKLKVILEDGHETATIDKVYVEKPYAAPGEEVKILCVVKPYNKEAYTETLSFQIPRDTPDGNLLIGVAGGDQIDHVRNRLGINDPDPESLKQIADKIRKEGRGDELNLVVALAEQSLLIDGVKINDPPNHWSKLLFSNRHTKGPQIVKGELSSAKLSNYLLYGSHILTVEVRSKDKATAKTAPATITSNNNSSDDTAITELARKTLGSSGLNKERNAIPVRGGAIIIQEMTPSTTTSSQTSTSASSSSTSSKNTTNTSSGILQPAKAYPHMRFQQIWRQETQEDLQDGKCQGTTIDSWGRISPSFDNPATASLSPESIIWSGCYANGYSYFSTSNNICRWRGDEKKPEQVCKLETTLIPALAADSEGTVYAACVPQGQIYALKNDGSVKAFFKTKESVITSLCFDDKDNLYVGVAGNGKVYKISKSQDSKVVFDSGQAHITALFFCKQDGKLYIGTGERAAVYALDSEGKAKAICQSQNHIISGIAKNKSGDLYVSTAASGHLVRILPSGEAQPLATSDSFFTLHYNEQNDLIFAGDAEGDITMACIEPVTKLPFFIPINHTEQEAVMALVSNGNQLFSGSSNLAALKLFNIQSATSPYYESKVKDGGRLANWRRMNVYGAFVEADKNFAQYLKVESRTGNTSKADQTWSDWTTASYDNSSYVLKSPQGRYMQYRLTWLNTMFDPTNKKVGPQIGRVDVLYLPMDTAAQFSSISLKPQTALSKKHSLSVTATDADNDNLLLSLEISSDAGESWKSLASDLRSKNALKEISSKKPISGSEQTKLDKPEESSSVIKTEDTKDNEKKESVDEKANDLKPKQLSSLFHKLHIFLDNDEKEKAKEDKKEESPAEDNDTGAIELTSSKAKDKDKDTAATSITVSTKAPDSSSTSESFSWQWDTTKQKDGNYILKFILDDRLSNPEEHLQTINVRSVVVDNNAPEITSIECKRKNNKTVECRVTAKDKTSPIVNALYRIDEGEFYALAESLQNNDGLSISLFATDIECASNAHKIEVKVSDRAGNTTSKSSPIK